MSEKITLEEWTAATKEEFEKCSPEDWPNLMEEKVLELVTLFEMSEVEALGYVHEM